MKSENVLRRNVEISKGNSKQGLVQKFENETRHVKGRKLPMKY